MSFPTATMPAAAWKKALGRGSKMSLRDAIAWIADNDNPGDDDLPEELAGYLTVVLVADLYGVPAEDVAAQVWRCRDSERGCDS